MRQPHDAGAVGAQARIGREIATPSAARAVRTSPGSRRLRQRPTGRPPDIRNRAAETPKRTPWSRGHRDRCKRRRSASQSVAASIFPHRSIRCTHSVCRIANELLIARPLEGKSGNRQPQLRPGITIWENKPVSFLRYLQPL
jgi:hypothetical protein